LTTLTRKRPPSDDDTEPIAFLRKPKIFRKSHQNSPSQLEMATLSLTELKNSVALADPINSLIASHALAFQTGSPIKPLTLSHTSLHSGFLNRQATKSPPPLQMVTLPLKL